MIKKKIQLNKQASDNDFKRICETMKKQGVFSACGNCDDKWIIGKWEDEVDYAAWLYVFTNS